jgi:hypothetical protein
LRVVDIVRERMDRMNIPTTRPHRLIVEREQVLTLEQDFNTRSRTRFHRFSPAKVVRFEYWCMIGLRFVATMFSGSGLADLA